MCTSSSEVQDFVRLLENSLEEVCRAGPSHSSQETSCERSSYSKQVPSEQSDRFVCGPYTNLCSSFVGPYPNLYYHSPVISPSSTPSSPIPNNLPLGAREPIDVSVESKAQISSLMTPPNSFTPSIPLILSLTS